MSNVIKEIPITIKNQKVLLNLVSEGYKSVPKALMEYIDNAFDSADEIYNIEEQKYERDIKIIINIDRSKREITVKDNCQGMSDETLEGLANSINESQKKRKAQKRAWVNGQFGLGAHAFRFFAKELKVTSKQQYYSPISLSINRNNNSASKIKPNLVSLDPSGTLVELKEIDRYHMKNLKANKLKEYAEQYFEQLLNRNVEIVIFDDLKKFVCKPFDYESLTGYDIKKVIDSWKAGDITVTAPEDRKIIVNLKVCTDMVNKPPFFSRKGRIINQIGNLDSFIRMTSYKKKLWDSFYLTGYIEVQESLKPVVTRDDFLGGRGEQKTRSGVYSEIIKLEKEIYDAIDVINKDKNDKSLQSLASVLTDLLSKIALEDDLHLKYQAQGEDLTPEEKILFNPDPDGSDVFKVGKGTSYKKIEKPGSNEKIIKGSQSTSGEKKGIKQQRNKEGVKIEFSTLESPEVRSHFADGEITIFTTHPDFQNRRGLTNKGELGSMRITARLANYLAAVISSEFKEVFYSQNKLEPDRKLILEEQIDFIFRFENMMKNFINQPLDSLGNINDQSNGK